MEDATIPFTYVDDAGDELEAELPAICVVCSTCRGKGTHVNRAIDGNGISQEQFDEDPDFAEAYFSGVYDVACEECKGQRVVYEVDRKNADKELLRYYDEMIRDARETDAAMAAERRMGA